jgi:hypothetical protein
MAGPSVLVLTYTVPLAVLAGCRVPDVGLCDGHWQQDSTTVVTHVRGEQGFCSLL